MVQAPVNKAENAYDYQREQDEIARQNGVGDKRIKGLVRKVAGVIERISALLPCRDNL